MNSIKSMKNKDDGTKIYIPRHKSKSFDESINSAKITIYREKKKTVE